MTEKIKLTKKQAEAIDYLKENYYEDFNYILNRHSKEEWINVAGLESLEGLSTLELATALIVGYEVVMTPHEVIATEYAASQQDWVNNEYLHSKGFVEGIEFTLNMLDIKIKGIND